MFLPLILVAISRSRATLVAHAPATSCFGLFRAAVDPGLPVVGHFLKLQNGP